MTYSKLYTPFSTLIAKLISCHADIERRKVQGILHRGSHRRTHDTISQRWSASINGKHVCPRLLQPKECWICCALIPICEAIPLLNQQFTQLIFGTVPKYVDRVCFSLRTAIDKPLHALCISTNCRHPIASIPPTYTIRLFSSTYFAFRAVHLKIFLDSKSKLILKNLPRYGSPSQHENAYLRTFKWIY